MNDKSIEALDVIEKLNSVIEAICADKEYNDQFIGLEFNTDGNTSCINFLNLHIWDSDNDPREICEDGEYTESIRMYVINKMLKILDVLTMVKDVFSQKENKKEIAVKKALRLIGRLNVEMVNPDITTEEKFKLLWNLVFIDLKFLEDYREP